MFKIDLNQPLLGGDAEGDERKSAPRPLPAIERINDQDQDAAKHLQSFFDLNTLPAIMGCSRTLFLLTGSAYFTSVRAMAIVKLKRTQPGDINSILILEKRLLNLPVAEEESKGISSLPQPANNGLSLWESMGNVQDERVTEYAYLIASCRLSPQHAVRVLSLITEVMDLSRRSFLARAAAQSVGVSRRGLELGATFHLPKYWQYLGVLSILVGVVLVALAFSSVESPLPAMFMFVVGLGLAGLGLLAQSRTFMASKLLPFYRVSFARRESCLTREAGGLDAEVQFRLEQIQEIFDEEKEEKESLAPSFS